jgi:riboflavin biosynthesis pyrimidine reductase
LRRIVPVGDTTGTAPDEAAELIAAERRDHADGTPWVFANMVTTIDGAATMDGVSAGLGGPADRVVFSALRAEADVILVGAETVRAERYRLAREPQPAALAHRHARGQGPRPRLCIVTRGVDLGGTPPLLDQLPDTDAHADDWQRPLIGTISANAAERTFDGRFDVVEAGTDSVDLGLLVSELGRRGLRRILCEGGPSLLAQLDDDGLVDEWNFTVAPIVAAGPSVRPVHSSTSSKARLHLDRVFLAEDSTMFTRYVTGVSRSMT